VTAEKTTTKNREGEGRSEGFLPREWSGSILGDENMEV